MQGVGGTGPRVQCDVLVSVRWMTADGTWSLVVGVSCGVVPDETFPGQLTLGRTFFHKIGLSSHDDGLVRLAKAGGATLLPATQAYTSSPAGEIADTVFATTTTPFLASSSPALSSELVAKAIKSYVRLFPSFFDEAKGSSATPVHSDAPAEAETRPDELNRIDFLAIFEHLHLQQPLPPRLTEPWVRSHFVVFQERLWKVREGQADATALKSAASSTLPRVPEHDELVNEAARVHEVLGHSSVGYTLRELGQRYWHPEAPFAVHEAIRTCRKCQLMRPPDPALPNLSPIPPAPPLTKWAADHTTCQGQTLFVAVEYATGWLVASPVPSTGFEATTPWWHIIGLTFGWRKGDHLGQRRRFH